MESDEEEYAEFIKKVRRTVYIDNISPKVTESVMKAAFNQFGNVIEVQFIPPFMQPSGAPQAVLLEMENRKQAVQIVEGLQSCPFMIAGMPRPVRAKAAEVTMFDDRPRKPGMTIKCRWLHRKDPNFETSQKIKALVIKHSKEASFVLEVVEEERLDKLQAETLGIQCKKLDLIERICTDGSVSHLSRQYGSNGIDSDVNHRRWRREKIQPSRRKFSPRSLCDSGEIGFRESSCGKNSTIESFFRLLPQLHLRESKSLNL
ncbi:uncharacterized protein LOC127239950 isoform X2 [Andrographis paniculata]|uniref:uncharacterized protein LOC127239950 isoform X2 n=1 Tax=Andrographis paniculata TaxID=175694 RepID=UPI0021E8F824|nr:uncharacterized protein LOC127239950 isoform X2 [Andrographis paniculata]